MENEVSVDAALERIREHTVAGRLDAANEECRILAQRAPQVPRVWIQLGRIAAKLGRLAEAEAAIRKVLELEPNNAPVWNWLGRIARSRDHVVESEQHLRKAVALQPEVASFWLDLGTTLCDVGSWDDAVNALAKAHTLDAQNALTLSNLAVATLRVGRKREAEAHARQALALDSSNAQYWANLGACLLEQRGLQEAVNAFQEAIFRAPGNAAIWSNLGEAERRLGHLVEAQAAFERSLAIEPTQINAGLGLACVMIERGRAGEALDQIQRITTQSPNFPEAWLAASVAFWLQGRPHESSQSVNRAMELGPESTVHGALLVQSQYRDGVSPGALLESHRQWDAIYAQPLKNAAPPQPARLGSDRRLRIGFVSTDFRIHPIGFLALRAFEQLKPHCALICYSDRMEDDFVSRRFRASASLWRDAVGLSNEGLVDLIRQDEIDILIDLTGHAGRRLLVFARRPAPVQMTWLGYVGTTGMEAIDYILADRFHIREGENKYYTEKVLRMPHGYACFGPPDYAPAVGPLPARAAGDVTFGCFNNPLKFSDCILDTWAKILFGQPSSKLLLRYGGLDEPTVKNRLLERFATRGIAVDRLIVEGWASHADLLASYNRVDLALDTMPYSGGLTTCEALWMGVPVITTPSETFAGRHSTSHLSNAGYGQFVAADLNGYVDLAVEWANRLDELAAIRAEMRERVRKSPLCDAPRFAEDFLALLNQAWTGQKP